MSLWINDVDQKQGTYIVSAKNADDVISICEDAKIPAASPGQWAEGQVQVFKALVEMKVIKDIPEPPSVFCFRELAGNEILVVDGKITDLLTVQKAKRGIVAEYIDGKWTNAR
jgi:hypothetical protein